MTGKPNANNTTTTLTNAPDSQCKSKCPTKVPICSVPCTKNFSCQNKFVDCNTCFISTCIGNDSTTSSSDGSSNENVGTSSVVIGSVCGAIGLVILIIGGVMLFRYRRFKEEQGNAISTSKAKLVSLISYVYYKI